MAQHIVLSTVVQNGDAVQVWKSHLDTLSTVPLKRDYVAAQLKASFPQTVSIAGLQGLAVDL